MHGSMAFGPSGNADSFGRKSELDKDGPFETMQTALRLYYYDLGVLLWKERKSGCNGFWV